MSEGERVYFQPGANPPFPGYEAWLEAVKRAPIWQAKGPRPYVPDMRDGLGKELFPPPPPRSNLEPEESRFYDRDTALAVMDFIWATRPDLVWELIWWDQFSRDEPDAGEEYDTMFQYAISHAVAQKISADSDVCYTFLNLEIRRQIRSIIEEIPIVIRRAPWLSR